MFFGEGPTIFSRTGVARAFLLTLLQGINFVNKSWPS